MHASFYLGLTILLLSDSTTDKWFTFKLCIIISFDVCRLLAAEKGRILAEKEVFELEKKLIAYSNIVEDGAQVISLQ